MFKVDRQTEIQKNRETDRQTAPLKVIATFAIFENGSHFHYESFIV